jgi:hypothetical protein
MNNNYIANYGDLGQLYAEMVVLCQPFYQFPPTSNEIVGNSSQQKEEEFYLHPRLEDGLQCHEQHRQHQCQHVINQYENPQDAAAAGKTTTTVLYSLESDNNCIATSTSSMTMMNRNDTTINNYYSQYNHEVRIRL